MRVLLLLEESPRRLSCGERAKKGKEMYEQGKGCFCREGKRVANRKEIPGFPSVTPYRTV